MTTRLWAGVVVLVMALGAVVWTMPSSSQAQGEDKASVAGTAKATASAGGITGAVAGDITAVRCTSGGGLAGGAESGAAYVKVMPGGIRNGHLANGIVTSTKIRSGAVTPGKCSFYGVGSLNGVSTDWGNIDLIPGTGITITPDDVGKTITISASGSGPGDAWSLNGNAGTDPVTSFLGTTDNVPLELRVNDTRAMRIEPNADSPNIIGGYSGNSVTGGVAGATIGGGGQSDLENTVAGDYGTVSGGKLNEALAECATACGGYANTVSGLCATIGGGEANEASGSHSTVGGGESNTSSTSWATVGGGCGNNAYGHHATIAGGAVNHASEYGATVGGGESNVANGPCATVPGGLESWASGLGSFAAGCKAKAIHQGAFVWADSMGADFTSTADDEFSVRARGGVRFVLPTGGLRLEPNATSPNIIGGYSGNSVTNGVVGATIAGGGNGLLTNHVTDDYGTVAGGIDNWAGDNAGLTSDASYASVGGGNGNRLYATYSTCGGGYGNALTGSYATVGGGSQNTAGTSSYATVGGGQNNTASGGWATSPGGLDNDAAGNYSFAAGRRANANNIGSFAWADSTNADFNVSNDNRFGVRASGGVYLYTNSGLTTGSYLAAGSGTWTSVSDRNVKTDVRTLDGKSVLEKLCAMPVSTWQYKTEDASIRHAGPMAQDFHAAFGLGDSDKSIGVVDADGISFAAIQGLYKLVQEKDATIATQGKRLEALEERLAALEGRK